MEETKRRRKYTGNWHSREDEKDKVCLCILPTPFSTLTASCSTLQADNCLSPRLTEMTRGDEEETKHKRKHTGNWRSRENDEKEVCLCMPSALTASSSTLQTDDCLSTRLTQTRRRGVEETKRRRKYTGNWRSREDEKDKVCLCILPTLFSAPTASSSTLQADNCLSSRLRGMTRGDEEAYRPTRQP